ncbi:hypothetical protein CONLIGDRAFT_711742 [Coniochaeta ligniaria NRRL 30616]|uniref:C2H2-type domain-containing protein n=1 Tax=Coniochaeta ligniaria NRRL 30616 TaxID=1408157 RepID=A0A1J7JV47_9PEZI|nr:hypothetical protein CONLIGDRAFT_711742 [Coniochaeta ligniaria NRRL 30616]
MASFRASEDIETTASDILALKAQLGAEDLDQDQDDSESSDDDDEWEETIFMPSMSSEQSPTSIQLPTWYSRHVDTHPFISADPSIVHELLAEFKAWKHHADDGGGTSGSASTSSEANNQDTADTRTPSGARARKRGAEAGEDEDDSEEDQGGSRKRSKKPRLPGERQRLLACPFAKKDPRKYRECYRFRIKRIQDVKAHLRRHHDQPIYCHCCKDKFKSEADLQIHAEANCCSPRREVVEGVDRDQKAKLSKPVPRGCLEDQWFYIFDILFPGFEPKPRSPYVSDNLEPAFSAFRDYMANDGAMVLMGILQARGLVTTSAGDEGQLLLAALAEGQEAIANEWNSTRAEPFSHFTIAGMPPPAADNILPYVPDEPRSVSVPGPSDYHRMVFDGNVEQKYGTEAPEEDIDLFDQLIFPEGGNEAWLGETWFPDLQSCDLDGVPS